MSDAIGASYQAPSWAPYAGTRVLVLGASGFIGRWVARKLSSAGAHVTSVAREVDVMKTIAVGYGISGEIVSADLRDSTDVAALFEAVRPEITFNLAGYGIDRSERDEALSWRINAALVGELATLAAATPVSGWTGLRLVHTGSALEYGVIGGHLPEDATPDPTTLYGQTKLAGTRQLLAHPSCRGVTARLFTIYGAGEHAGRLLPSLMAAAQGDAAVPLSEGTQQRDFTYVEDVVEGLLRLGLLEAVPGGVVNLATGKLYSVRNFAETAAAVLGLPAERLQFGALPQRPDEMPHDRVSVERLRQSISWVPTTTVADGVRRTAEFSGALPP
jgi:UDP-glucose 4-epimerase